MATYSYNTASDYQRAIDAALADEDYSRANSLEREMAGRTFAPAGTTGKPVYNSIDVKKANPTPTSSTTTKSNSTPTILDQKAGNVPEATTPKQSASSFTDSISASVAKAVAEQNAKSSPVNVPGTTNNTSGKTNTTTTPTNQSSLMPSILRPTPTVYPNEDYKKQVETAAAASQQGKVVPINAPQQQPPVNPQPEAQPEQTPTPEVKPVVDPNAARDEQLRSSFWDTKYDTYGSYKDFDTAAKNAYAAGDLAAAAAIEIARNKYIDASGNTAYGGPTNRYVQEYEIYTKDEAGKVAQDNNKANQDTYGQPTKTTVRASDGMTITFYTFEDANGVEHISAKTVSGDPIADGTQILVDTQTIDGATYETYMTWNSDNFRDDTGSWRYTTSVRNPGDTTGYNPSNFSAFLAYDDMSKFISSQIDQASDAEVAAINAATQKAISEIQQALAESDAEFAAMADAAYLQSMQNRDNLVLQNAAAGNYGGIAQKQYTTAQASYDQQLLAISLQYQALKTQADYKVAQLEADGQYEAAKAVANWANTKLNTMLSAYQWTEEMYFKQQEFDYEKEVTDRNYNYQRALSMLQQGILTADAAQSLGISAQDAQSAADYYNSLAQTNLSAAEAQLAKQLDSGTPVTPESQLNTYEKLYLSGAKTLDEAYEWLVRNGFNQSAAEKLADYYASTQYERLNKEAQEAEAAKAAEEARLLWQKYDARIANRHSATSNWVEIPGRGRMTIQEAVGLVNNGSLEEMQNSDGTVSFLNPAL